MISSIKSKIVLLVAMIGVVYVLLYFAGVLEPTFDESGFLVVMSKDEFVREDDEIALFEIQFIDEICKKRLPELDASCKPANEFFQAFSNHHEKNVTVFEKIKWNDDLGAFFWKRFIQEIWQYISIWNVNSMSSRIHDLDTKRHSFANKIAEELYEQHPYLMVLYVLRRSLLIPVGLRK